MGGVSNAKTLIGWAMVMFLQGRIIRPDGILRQMEIVIVNVGSAIFIMGRMINTSIISGILVSLARVNLMNFIGDTTLS